MILQTLELLHSMANPDNVQVICKHMLAHLHKEGADEYLKTDVIAKVTHLTQKYPFRILLCYSLTYVFIEVNNNVTCGVFLTISRGVLLKNRMLVVSVNNSRNLALDILYIWEGQKMAH